MTDTPMLSAADQAEREKYIRHILKMKQTDQDLARHALKRYHEAMPWLGLMDGVREALK